MAAPARKDAAALARIGLQHKWILLIRARSRADAARQHPPAFRRG